MSSPSNTSFKQIAKTSEETPHRMKPTRRSCFLQACICISGVSTAITHGLARDNEPLLYTFSFLWIISAFLGAYYEMDWHALKLVILSFRGILITSSCLMAVTVNIAKKVFFTTEEPWMTLIIDDITFIISVIILVLADCVPTVTNFVRIFGPFVVISNVIWVTAKDVFLPDFDYTLFTYLNGSITLNDISIAANIQIFWFGFPYMYGVPKDPSHHFFVLINEKIKVKQLMPYASANISFRIPSNYIFIAIEVFFTLFGIVYVISDSSANIQSIQVPFLVINVILAMSVCVLTLILIYNHFEWDMIKELVLQFRCNMLILTVLISIYCIAQKLIWCNYRNANVTTAVIIQILLNHLVWSLAVILCVLRDAMNIKYPNYFVILSAVLIFGISVWNIFSLTFVENGQYPKWFILIEKQAYYSVIFICVLSLYHVLIDKQNKYFILIRKRKKTKELWGDESNASVIELKDVAMNETLLDTYDMHDML